MCMHPGTVPWYIYSLIPDAAVVLLQYILCTDVQNTFCYAMFVCLFPDWLLCAIVHVSVTLCACGSSCLCRKTRIPVSRTPRSSSCTLLDILNPSIIIITTMMMNTMVMNSDAPLLEEESLCRQLAIINILTNSFKKHLKHCSPCIYVPIYERHSARHTVHKYETNKHQYIYQPELVGS